MPCWCTDRLTFVSARTMRVVVTFSIVNLVFPPLPATRPIARDRCSPCSGFTVVRGSAQRERDEEEVKGRGGGGGRWRRRRQRARKGYAPRVSLAHHYSPGTYCAYIAGCSGTAAIGRALPRLVWYHWWCASCAYPQWTNVPIFLTSPMSPNIFFGVFFFVVSFLSLYQTSSLSLSLFFSLSLSLNFLFTSLSLP